MRRGDTGGTNERAQGEDLGLKSLRFLGLENLSGALIAVQLLLSLLSNLVLGAVFVSRGLLSCLVVKLAFGLEYLAVARLVL